MSSMRPQIVFMFSGQGSQYYQMGRDLYDGHAVFRRTLDQYDRIVRDHGGFSLIDATFSSPGTAVFDDLRLSHPALLAFEFAMYETLVSEGVVPDQVWGSSLGELAAAAVAGCCSYETALRMAIAQAAEVVARCPPGGSLAILGRREDLAALSCGGSSLTYVGENFPGHFTVAAPAAAIDRVAEELKSRSINSIRLPLRYAFHSVQVEAARSGFLAACASLDFSAAPRLPLVSTMSTQRVERFTPEYFWQVVTGPMRFRDTLLRLELSGPAVYIDCGPAGTSATFVKYNLSAGSNSAQFPILSPFRTGLRNLEKIKSEHPRWR